ASNNADATANLMLLRAARAAKVGTEFIAGLKTF
ncbi:hypothetical protein AK812_SmicGene48369, partial [Symbiodinium microadriaticum]